MDKNVKILVECINGCHQKEISDILGWKEGATATAIKRLLEKQFLEKTERGIYRTTESGKKYVTKHIDDEDAELDCIVNAILAINLKYRNEINSFWNFWKPVTRKFVPNKEVKELGVILDKIYFKTAERLYSDFVTVHRNAKTGLAKSLWVSLNNKMPTWFIKIADEHIEKINQLSAIKMDSKKLFNLMWFFSLPIKERMKQNLKSLVSNNKSKK